jgi:hypothetical protein
MFSPLGNFKADAPIQVEVIEAAKAFKVLLPEITAGLITRMYCHWTVAGLCSEFSEYNAEAEYANGKHFLKMTHDPRDNAPGLNNNSPASHTWHRNTGAVGIAITGMDGATESNFGPDGITLAGLEYLCAGAAALASKYSIDVNGKVEHGSTHADNNGNNVNTIGEPTVLTHGECAVIDAYPTERWDLGTFIALPLGISLTPAMRTECGSALRTRIHLYKLALI